MRSATNFIVSLLTISFIVDSNDAQVTVIPVYPAVLSPKFEKVVSSFSYSWIQPFPRFAGYNIQVSIGPESDAQIFRLNLDTGSGKLWVAKDSCTTCPDETTNNTKFNASKSLGFVATDGKIVDIVYGDGNISATAGADFVTIGDLVVSNQEILLVHREDDVMQSEMRGQSDGIIGVAYQYGIGVAKANILSNIAQIFKDPDFFGLWLNQTAIKTISNPGPDSVLGFMMFSAIDPSLYYGTLKFVPLVPIAGGYFFYWSIATDAVFIKSTNATTRIQAPQNTIIVIDSGSSLISLDSSTLRSIVSAINGNQIMLKFDSQQGLFASPCASISQQNFPQIVFSVGYGVELVMDGVDYVQSLDDQCLLAIKSNDNSSEWILGDVFLRKYITVFDLRYRQVGFAIAANGQVAGNGVRLTHEARAAGSWVQISSTKSSIRRSGFLNGFLVFCLLFM